VRFGHIRAATRLVAPASVMPQAALGTSKDNPVLAVLAALHRYTTYVSLPPMFILAMQNSIIS
jgi:hypothetical protein